MNLALKREDCGDLCGVGSKPGQIFIPHELRGRPINEFSFSVRLRHVLERRGIKLLGDLHGLNLAYFLKLDNCGKRTVTEIADFVRSVQTGANRNVASAYQPISGRVFSIAPNAAKLSVRELPTSVRLSRILAKKGIETIGQLNGIAVYDLLAEKNCGRKTVVELVDLLCRSAKGEYQIDQYPKEGSYHWSAVHLIDKIFQKSPSRNERILLLRFGGCGCEPLTLEEVGINFKLTRERVRQVVEKSITRIRKASGPKMSHFLRQIAAGCEEKVCPLTEELLQFCLGEHAVKCRFPMAFYIRLLYELNPSIPVWPKGQYGRCGDDDISYAIMSELEHVLGETNHCLSLKDAFAKLCSQKFPKLNVAEFLSSLRTCTFLKVEFKQPDQPKVSLGRLRAADLAKAALQSSDKPLTPEEILQQAGKLFTSDLLERSPRGLGNCLTLRQGFYLLGPRAYGLRKHFHLSDKDWPQVKADFIQMLKKANCPVSTHYFLNEWRDKWGTATNSYELAQILREDEQFVNLGRKLFALADWGVEERPYIKDLVTKILTDSGHLMTTTEIFERLKSFRSVSGGVTAKVLRGHPLVRDYGFGHFGLRSWNEAPKSEIVSSTVVVERIIRRADPPLTMKCLCEIVNIPANGQLAAKLWETCRLLKLVIRKPDKCSPETVLLHKKCSLERALVAIARQTDRPLPVYEIQWELNKYFGYLFGKRSLDEIKRCLGYSPMFVRDAEDNFILEVHLDRMGFDTAGIRDACFGILSQANEIVGCEDLLERLEAEGEGINDLSPEILAAMLRGGDEFEEVGRSRFRAKPCKH